MSCFERVNNLLPMLVGVVVGAVVLYVFVIANSYLFTALFFGRFRNVIVVMSNVFLFFVPSFV